MKPSEAAAAGYCPSCLGRGTVAVLVPEPDEEAECLTCGGTGEFPVRCNRCRAELFLDPQGEWSHVFTTDHIASLAKKGVAK